MKAFLLFMVLYNLSVCFSQDVIDTVNVYNVNCCSETEVNAIVRTIDCWGGIYCEFYRPEECENPSKKYTDSNELHEQCMNSEKLFWIRLYDTKDNLIFEGLRFSDASVGSFKAYHPNGNLMVEGQYTPCKVKGNGEIKFVKSAGQPTGTWKYYDENGSLTQEKNYP